MTTVVDFVQTYPRELAILTVIVILHLTRPGRWCAARFYPWAWRHLLNVTLERKTHRKSEQPNPRWRDFSPATKRAAMKRAKGRCEYEDPDTRQRCLVTTELQYDHDWPHSRGGTNYPANCRVLCAPHNRQKSNRRPGVDWHDGATEEVWR